MSEQERRLLSVQQAAQYLGLAEKTIYAMIESDRIPCVCIGRRRLLDKSALEEFIKANTRGERAK